MELVGKHPSDVETNTYDINPDLPVFMSVKDDQDTTDEFTKYLSDINKYFTNDYA